MAAALGSTYALSLVSKNGAGGGGGGGLFPFFSARRPSCLIQLYIETPLQTPRLCPRVPPPQTARTVAPFSHSQPSLRHRGVAPAEEEETRAASRPLSACRVPGTRTC